MYLLQLNDGNYTSTQKMVLMKNAAQSAQNFYRFLQTNEARKIWRKYGYE